MGAGTNSYYNPRTGKWTRPKREWDKKRSSTTRRRKKNDACYVATAVYGSYDCPEVWTLRRYRDNCLANNLFGKIFIKVYYLVSPLFVELFGKTNWFNKLFRSILDRSVTKLNKRGYSSEKYKDAE